MSGSQHGLLFQRARASSLEVVNDLNTIRAIQNFLKILQINAKACSIDKLTIRSLNITIADREPLRVLVESATEDPELQHIKMADFDGKSWVYSVVLSIFIYFNRQMLNKIGEYWSRTISVPELYRLIENENLHVANAFGSLLLTSIANPSISEACDAVLDYYLKLLENRNSLQGINPISTTVSMLLMRVSQFRFKPEHKTPATNAIYDKLKSVAKKIAEKHVKLNSLNAVKSDASVSQSFSAKSIAIAVDIMNVLNSQYDTISKDKELKRIDTDVQRLATHELPAVEKNLLQEFLSFCFFAIRPVNGIHLGDSDDAALAILRDYVRFEKFNNEFSVRMNKSGEEPSKFLPSLNSKVMQSFVDLILQKLSDQLSANSIDSSDGQKLAVRRVLGNSFDPVVPVDVINLINEPGKTTEVLFGLIMQKVITKCESTWQDRSSNIEQAYYLLENSLLIAPNLFVRYPNVAKRFITIIEQQVIDKSEQHPSRLAIQADLRWLLEQLCIRMHLASLAEQQALKPFVISLHALILSNIQQTTTKRAMLELYSQKEWILKNGHRGTNHLAPTGIIDWYQAMMTQLETCQIWQQSVQPDLTKRSSAAGAIAAFLSVDISYTDAVARQHLMARFEDLYSYYAVLDIDHLCGDLDRAEKLLCKIEVLIDVLDKESDTKYRSDCRNLLKRFIANLLPQLTKQLQQAGTEERDNDAERIIRGVNFVVELIHLGAIKFSSDDPIQYVTSWFDHLQSRFSNMQLLFDRLHDLLEVLATAPSAEDEVSASKPSTNVTRVRLGA